MNELDAYVEARSSTPAPKRGVTPVCVCLCVCLCVCGDGT